MNPQLQNSPEVITKEWPKDTIHSRYHFYEHSPSICAYFGCGKEMSLEESRRGNHCFRHYGGHPSPATLMWMREMIIKTQKEIDSGLHKKHLPK